MGFLKRFFSIGSRKNGRKNAVIPGDNSDHGLARIQEEEQEAALSRLLRSSSARFAVVSEVDYTSLPPLPHPINNVVNTTEVTLGGAGVARAGSYNVTVHGRTRCTVSKSPHTDLPESSNLGRTAPCLAGEPMVAVSPTEATSMRHRSTIPPFLLTPRESNSLLVLRHDPSVISLLNMYDDHGRLPQKAFSNTPPSRDRVQTHRNGSSLRQLLGSPVSRDVGQENDNSSALGDISWAEHILRENDAYSSTSSLGVYLDTPISSLDSPFTDNRSCHEFTDNAFPNQHRFSYVTDAASTDNLAISSMEVEISRVVDSPPLSVLCEPSSPYIHDHPMTPQRASQVFGFLMEKRRSYNLQNDIGPHPPHPARLSTIVVDSPFKSCLSDCAAKYVLSQIEERTMPIPNSRDTHTNIHPRIHSLYSSRSFTKSFVTQLHADHLCFQSACLRSSAESDDNENTVRNTSQTRLSPFTSDIDKRTVVRDLQQTTRDSVVFATIARAPPTHNHSTTQYEPSAYPAVEFDNYADAPVECRMNSISNRETYFSVGLKSKNLLDPNVIDDQFTPLPSRKRNVRRRRSLQESISTQSTEAHPRFNWNFQLLARAIEKECQVEIENDLDEGTDLPVTPLRTQSQTLFDSQATPSLSTELSPYGQQLMTDLRQQRARARESERAREKKGRRRR